MMAETDHHMLACSKCGTPLPWNTFSSEGAKACPACDVPTYAFVFPALYAPPRAAPTGEQLVVDDEASCFYHAEKKAVIACERCGRFLCALCDVQLGEEHICPRCIEAGVEKNKLRHLTKRYFQYDNLALALAVVPLLCVFWFATPVTAPAAVFIAIRYWKRPLSILPRSRWRYVLAVILALGELTGIGVFIVNLVKDLGSG